MSTAISLIPVSTPAVPPALTPYAQRTIQRAVSLLDKHLRQPGVSFLLCNRDPRLVAIKNGRTGAGRVYGSVSE